VKWVIAGCVFILVLGYAIGAQAQAVCGKHVDIVKRLNDGYQEVQSSTGIASNGNLVEVFASKKGGWTIIFTKPGGNTCLMAVGENWERVKNPFGLGKFIAVEGEVYPEEAPILIYPTRYILKGIIL